MEDHRIDVPDLPSGSIVELDRRGSTFVRRVEGPPGAPVLLLLHGLAATADLNWFACFGELRESFRVLAPDLRGHGAGVRATTKFDLEQCADDVAALIDTLDLDPVIVVGYSMGGFVAQLLWHRHRRRVAGLVLCATATQVNGNRHWLTYQTLAAATSLRYLPRAFHPNADLIADRLFGPINDQSLREWARREMRRNDLLALFSAMEAAVRFSSRGWANAIDVPTAVLIPKSDRVVPVERQLELAHVIPAASVYMVEGDHGVCVTAPAAFAHVLATACRDVADRAEGA
jgi:pimeloyl-ACP methyl ester carboxylesterase